jgi:regulator of protease activity HflC (stomatin/prohibitin superfamily)
MNRINAADREKTVAEFEAEASRIRIVAKAKAEAESKRLQGQGIADQRREIARGLVESVDVLNRLVSTLKNLLWLHSITIPYKL